MCRNSDSRGYALRWVRVSHKRGIRVSIAPRTQRRLGELDIADGYGEGKVAGRDALLVLTAKDQDGGAGQNRRQAPRCASYDISS